MGHARIAETPALQLRYIKALYLERRYRQCIQACRSLLDPTHEVSSHTKLFVNFYLGLAHDELARLMLEFSPAKVPCFRQEYLSAQPRRDIRSRLWFNAHVDVLLLTNASKAEQFYKEALHALPAVEAQMRLADATATVEQDPFLEHPTAAARLRTPEQIAHDSYYQFASPTSSPMRQLRENETSIRHPQTVSRETSGSDLTDVESHSSFDQILTPSKITPDRVARRSFCMPPSWRSQAVLQREFSRMSLLDQSPPRLPSSLPRTTSTVSDIQDVPMVENAGRHQQPMSSRRPIPRPPSLQQSLLKPIRMGSPAKAYQLPARPPRLSGNALSRSSAPRPPKLKIADLQQKPLPALPNECTDMAASCKEDSPVSPLSPISPLGDGGEVSEATTNSPVSPTTPPHRTFPNKPLPLVAEESDGELDRQPTTSQNIRAMERQLHSHIAMLDKIKQQTLAIQAAHAAENSQSLVSPAPLSRPGSSSSSRHDSVISAENRRFVPKTKSLRMMEQKADDPEQRRKRIETGRARMWLRPRFDPKRYIDLAEQALAEL